MNEKDNVWQTISTFISYGLDVKNETTKYICDSLVEWVRENEEPEDGCGDSIVYSKDLIDRIDSLNKHKPDSDNTRLIKTQLNSIYGKSSIENVQKEKKMNFIKETNVDDYANRLQGILQREYNTMCALLETCKKGVKDGVMRTGVNEYRSRKYEVEHIASLLGFSLDEKGE